MSRSAALRAAVVESMRFLEQAGLNTGSAGNASVRDGEMLWITPSGARASTLQGDAIVGMDLDGKVIAGTAKPSSEWRMHRDIYRARPTVTAVVHTHSSYAAALACCRKPIPAFHYMVAIAGGDSIRCARYATFGSQALSNAAVAALEGRTACLLENHGVLALGDSPEKAAALALEVEQLAKQYCIALSCGDPVILSDADMREVLEKFATYGQQ